MYNWWFKISNNGISFDTLMNRIEKESINSERMGLILVIKTSITGKKYTIYYTTTLDGEQINLFSSNEELVYKRSEIKNNGGYNWIYE